MARLLAKIDMLPKPVRGPARTLILGKVVPFVGTAGINVDVLSRERVTVTMRNRSRVQNHIKGIHAAAMALLAETATGFAVAMHIPDDRVPLVKSLQVEYLRRATGHLQATAWLSDDQITAILEKPKGEVSVAVEVTDTAGDIPIVCHVVWAWVPRRRKSNVNAA